MPEIEFVKMHGLGNDFVLVEDLEAAIDLSPEQVEAVCDRHTGVGGDGLILVRRGPDGTGFRMDYRNADGSLAEMCGNGIRCLAKYVVDRGLTDRDAFIVHTLGGPKEISVTRDEDGAMDLATVSMGVPVTAPADIPVLADRDPALDLVIETPSGAVRCTAVSMGNPHCVLFVDDVDAALVSSVGPLVERHEMFPHRTNVEFAQVIMGEDRIRLRVWERGVGETLACGTGACATVVAASLGGLTGRDVAVELPGGELRVVWAGSGDVLMTGPATDVFSGRVVL